MRNSSLANTVANRTATKQPLLHRSLTVPTGHRASSAKVPSALEENGNALYDGATDVMIGLQLPLQMPNIYKTVASTMAPGTLAFDRFMRGQQVQHRVPLSHSTVLAELHSSPIPPSVLAIDDKLIELIQHGFVYLGSVEVLASIACFCIACWLLQRCVLRRPRACLAVIGTWSFLFLLDLLVGRGPTACMKNIVHQSNEASQASRELAHSTVRFVAAWLSVLMPVLVDVAVVLATAWQQLSPRQRLFVCSSLVVLYAAITTFRAIRKHSRALGKMVFQTSFLVAGPVLWFLSGHLSPQGLQWALSCVLSGLPTLMSFHAACRGIVKQGTHTAWSCGRLGVLFWTQEEWCELWIAFWACWPVLMMLRSATQRLPQLFPNYENELLLPSELERALIVFTLWIQFWQGGLLLNHTIRSLLGAENGGILAGPATLINRLKCALPLMPQFQTVAELGKVFFRHRALGSTLQMLIVLMVVGLLVITWTFYHTFRLVCNVMVLLTVCFAAVDSASVVFKSSRDLYIKRLSFWVLLQIWRTASQVPLVGSGLSFATPVAFSLFFLAGDHILAWLLIPLASRLESLPNVLATTLVSMAYPSSRGLNVKGEASTKPEKLTERTSTHSSQHWQVCEETLFNLFVAPVTELLSVSNRRVALAIKALLAEDKTAV